MALTSMTEVTVMVTAGTKKPPERRNQVYEALEGSSQDGPQLKEDGR